MIAICKVLKTHPSALTIPIWGEWPPARPNKTPVVLVWTIRTATPKKVKHVKSLCLDCTSV